MQHDKGFLCHGRRRLLRWSLALPIAVSTGKLAAARSLLADDRSLAFVNLHTDERLKATYWKDGRYVPSVMSRIDHLLRDFRTDDVIQMDPALLDQLHLLRRLLDSREPFHVISGYRSPATNAKLARQSNGVAKRSLHMQGRAIDVRLPGTDLRRLRDAARSLELGGVGYYPKSNFVHLDTGRIRSW